MSDEDRSKPAPALGRIIIAEGAPERFAEILRRLDEPTSESENSVFQNRE